MSYQVGDIVEFTDEFGNTQVSIITATDVMPEENKDLYAIDGSYGCYLRFEGEIQPAPKKEKQA